MPKWPNLIHWPLDQLFRLRASWREIRVDTEQERVALNASMEELEALIQQKLSEKEQP